MGESGVLLLLLASFGGTAQAMGSDAPAVPAPPPPPAREPAAERPVVVVSVAAHGTDADRVAEALMTHLTAGDLRVVFDRSGPASTSAAELRESLSWAANTARRHNAVGVLWVDVSQPDELVLSSANSTGERVLTRRIPADPNSPAAALEALGIIARTTSLALAAGHEIGVHRREHDAVTVMKERTPPQPPWPRVVVGIEYAGGNYADRIPWQHGVGTQVLGRPIPKLLFGLGYTYVFPAVARHPVAALEIQRNPVAALFGYHHDLGKRGSVELMGSMSVDPVRVRVAGVRPPLLAEEPATRVLAAGGAATRWEVRPWRELGIYLSVGAEVLLTTFNYVARAEDGKSYPLVSPHRIRGLAAVGIRHGLARRGPSTRSRRSPSSP